MFLSPKKFKGWRLLLAIFLLALFGVAVLWESAHFVKFGDLFGYGYHVDLFVDHSDVGVPRMHTAHCFRVSNYTVRPLRFEAIQLPGGITDGEVIYHDRVEKWNEQSHSWSPVFDSANDPSFSRPNTVKTVLPGGSIYATGCYEVATMEGIHKGDTVRLVAFTSYSTSSGLPGQLAFYSPAFTVHEESLKNTQKSDSGASTELPASATTR